MPGWLLIADFGFDDNLNNLNNMTQPFMQVFGGCFEGTQKDYFILTRFSLRPNFAHLQQSEHVLWDTPLMIDASFQILFPA